MISSTISIAAVAAKYYAFNELTTEGIVNINNSFNLGIITELGIFAIFEVSSFIAFLFNKVKINIGILVLNMLLFLILIVDIIRGSYSGTSYIYIIPIINSIIYIIINKK